MSKETLKPPEVIELMIDLRIQQAELEQQIQALKPFFFDACTQQNTDRIHNERALIYCRLTPGQWNYPSDIVHQEQQLKQLKEDFKLTHEPAAGREVSWTLKLLTN
jgi:hypothetical protein